MHLLRAEKGFIIVGQETDGTVTPADLGLGGMVKKKGDFIGRRSLFRSETSATDRKQLVGLLTDDPKVVMMEGAHVIGTRGGKRSAGADARLGHLELFQPEPRPLDRHGDGDRRAASAWASDSGSRAATERRCRSTVTGTDFLAQREKPDG